MTKTDSSNEQELTAKEVAARINRSLRTIQLWMATRPDIFPSAQKTGPSHTDPYVVKESDVIALEEKYPNLKK